VTILPGTSFAAWHAHNRMLSARGLTSGQVQILVGRHGLQLECLARRATRIVMTVCVNSADDLTGHEHIRC
jgi:hypothetical protein